MDVSTGQMAGIKLAAFSKSKSSKNEQFQQLKALDSTSCVVCQSAHPIYLSYIEPKTDDEVMHGSDMRIWYFACGPCLRRVSALALRSLLFGELNNHNN